MSLSRAGADRKCVTYNAVRHPATTQSCFFPESCGPLADDAQHLFKVNGERIPFGTADPLENVVLVSLGRINTIQDMSRVDQYFIK